jgi:glycosyltransferase involved in cell wall biosynthesis
MAVSVVVPLYNKARHIRRALDSVLAQSMQDFEVIVVDDGSTDGGGDVVREMNDARIRLIAQENRGVSAARNRGIRESSFEWVAFLDADDEWSPSFLETVTGLRARHPEAGMFATAYRHCQGETSARPAFIDCVQSPQGGLLDDYFRAALGPPPAWTSAVMVPKWVFSEVGYFPVGIRRGEDLNMWERIALRFRVAWSPVDGAVYHLSADNRACERRLESDVAAPSAVEEFLRSGEEALSPREVLEEYLVRVRLPLVVDLHLHGMRPVAMELLKKTEGTTRFRRRRFLVRFAVLIPPAILRIVLKMKVR